MPKEQGEHAPSESTINPYHPNNRSTPLPNNSNGLYCKTTRIGWIRFYPHYHRPQLHEDADCNTLQGNHHCWESGWGVAELFLWQIFPRFGLPSKIISDRDPQFISKSMKELCCLMGITQNISTAYHPQTDGQSERSNQWLEQYLCFWVDHQQTNWHHYLPLAEFTHNSWKNETTGQSPFEVLMGYNPRVEIFDVTLSIPTVALQLRDWKRAWEEVQRLMIKVQKRWTKGKVPEQRYKTGDQVWLEGCNLQVDWPSAKLAPKRHRPF